jgi:general secretion pathway protein D
VTSFQYQNVGVSLSVTPRISPDGVVKMDVGTTNSALSSQTQQVSPDVEVPIINERRATTTVSVQSGQSIIIGGLISSSDDNRSKKIPFLGDIPLLGVLFRSTRYSTDRKELLIVMTPQVLTRIAEDGLAITRKQLDRANIRTDTKRDEFEKQILQPLYPNNPAFQNDSGD